MSTINFIRSVIIITCSVSIFSPLRAVDSNDDFIKQCSKQCPIAKAFISHDENNDGKLCSSELTAALRISYAKSKMDETTLKKTSKSIFNGFDNNANGFISKSEYVAVLKSLKKK